MADGTNMRRSYTRGELAAILTEWFHVAEHPLDVKVMSDWVYDRGHADPSAVCRRCGRRIIANQYGLCPLCIDLMQHND